LWSALNFVSVKAEPQYYYVNISPLKDYYLKGENLNIQVTTNAPIYRLQIYLPNGKVWLNKTFSANSTQNFTIPQNALYGTYIVRAVAENCVDTKRFTVLDVSDWKPTVFPYSRKHKNILYTFYSNGTFWAEGSNGNVTLNFNSLIKLAKTHDLKVSATYNSMNFRVRFYNSETDINVNMVFSFIWKGCKFIVRGAIDKERQFAFNLSRHKGSLESFVDCVRSGNLVFDWSDLRRAKHRFEYNKETKVLTVDIPKSFNLDPYIFEDGFESGDFSNWSGTTASSGTISVTNANPKQGTYNARSELSGSGERKAYCYKSGFNEGIIHVRLYVMFKDAIPSASTSDGISIMYVRNVDNTAGLFQVSVGYTNSRWQGNYRKAGTWTTWNNASHTASLDTWYCVEAAYYVHATEGYFKVWVNETLIFEDTNIDTSQNGNAGEVRVGVHSSYSTNSLSHKVDIDCVVVDSSYIGPLSGGNNAPSIGEFQAPSTIYANQWFYLNASVNDADGISEIVNATIELSNSVILKWDNASATFSEQSDTNNYCTLNASACIETEKNSTAFKLSWRLKLNNYPSGSVNILSSNTKVWDSTESGSNNETGLFTFSYITLNLQARDSSGTNLPRSVTFSGTLGNGTGFTKTSDTNGLATLTTCYGTHTVQVKWGTHLVKSSTSFSVTSNKTQNFDTAIARLNSGSYYVLISINQTTPVTPEINGLPNWKMYGISGSGQKDLKVDVANWVDTSQPSIIKVMGNPYETGWNWDGTNKILSGFILDFDANPSLNLEMEWGTSSGGPGGSSGGSNTVPVTPEEEPEKPQDTINPPVYIIPEYQQPVIPANAVTTIIVGSCIVICIGLVINWLFEQNSTSKLWNRKSKKPKWKK